MQKYVLNIQSNSEQQLGPLKLVRPRAAYSGLQPVAWKWSAVGALLNEDRPVLANEIRFAFNSVVSH